MAKKGFLGFDLETTGLDPANDRIVEFSFIELAPTLVETRRWTQRVNPTIRIPDEATKIHGIRDADVAGCAPFAAHAPAVQALFNEHVPIGYNVDYDIEVLHHELVRAGQPGIDIEYPRIDPYQVYREFIPDLYQLSGAVRQYLGRDHDGAHGAEADAAATIDILRTQLARHAPLAERVQTSLLPAAPTGRTWLDRRRVFYADQAGTVRYGIKPNLDEPVVSNLGFLDWIARKDFPEETKAVAMRLRKSGGRMPPPGPR